MANITNALRTLTKAILEKRCVAIRCDDNSRLIAIEPHAIYSDTDSNIILDFYQLPAGNGAGNGVWNSIAWRNINAVFWLNTSFMPRLKYGFKPKLDKYQAGLLAMVSSGGPSRKNKLLWENVESSIEQLLARDPARLVKH